jgi:RNA polymerase sigma-70 factor (ECF subfamily)
LLNEPSDENLVRASRLGDKEAYAMLAKRHYKHVFVVCLGMLGRVHDAEDTAQEAMLKGFVNMRDLKKPSRFGSWIVTIARNECISLIRRRDYASKLVTQQNVPVDDELVPYQSLQRAIEQLPPENRLPVVMYYFDGESVKDVARKLNLSRSRVYQRLKTATEQLHRLLKKQGDVI